METTPLLRSQSCSTSLCMSRSFRLDAGSSAESSSSEEPTFPALVPHNPLTHSVTMSCCTNAEHKLKLTKRQWMIAFSLVYAQFWIAACVSLQAPFFPREAESKGVTPTEYGLSFGIYELTILVMSPYFGRLVSKYSQVRICELGFLFCGLSTILFGWIDRFDDRYLFIYSAYIVRIMEGVAAAALLTSSYTIMADKFPQHVATAFSYLEASFGFGLIVGPTVGGALYELGGFSYPFIILGTFLCFGFVLVKILLGGDPDKHPARQEKCSLSFFQFISDFAILYDSCAIISSLFFLGFNAATLEPHLRQFNLTPFFTGLIFIITGSVYALSTPIWGRLCAWKSCPKFIILIGSLMCACGIVFLGPLAFLDLEPSLPVIVTALFLIGLGIAAKMVCAFVDAMDNTIKVRGLPNTVATYGIVSAMFFSSCSTGAFLGPSLGGFLIDTIHYRNSTLFVLVIEIFMIIYGLLFLCRPTKPATSEESQNA